MTACNKYPFCNGLQIFINPHEFMQFIKKFIHQFALHRTTCNKHQFHGNSKIHSSTWSSYNLAIPNNTKINSTHIQFILEKHDTPAARESHLTELPRDQGRLIRSVPLTHPAIIIINKYINTIHFAHEVHTIHFPHEIQFIILMLQTSIPHHQKIQPSILCIYIQVTISYIHTSQI